jgi:ribose 5-phosphate isomerase RpiB
MRLGIATDHGGFELKEDLLARLAAVGHEAFLAAEFSQAERHLRRLAKVASLETKANSEGRRP